MRTPFRLQRFGLRARVIAAFGIGALGLSLLLSTVTYSLTRGNLVERRQSFAQTNAESNAVDLNSQFSANTQDSEFTRLMLRYPTPDGTFQGILHSGIWYWSDTFNLSGIDLPGALETAFEDGSAGYMTFDYIDAPYYTIGYPLPNAEADAIYVQATPLDDVGPTLEGLLITLLGASAVTTMLGAGFGVYVATRLFSPVSEVSAAAAQIADGDLDTRLEEVDDPDIGRLVSSFNEMSSALQERIERDSRFASDVSHELRSPLMTLTGSVAVLNKSNDELPERSQVALGLLSAEIGRFKVLVEDLLEISRFDIGAVQLASEEVLLSEFVRQALHAANAERDPIPVVQSPGAEDLIVSIDKRRLAQVIRNLCENADKYADGVTQARIQRHGDGVTIELEDRGPGVPVDERELIFERFARGSEGGRRGSGSGVGLGLSLVVEHLRLHGATIAVTDRLDKERGARFVISLPGVVVDE